MEPYPLTIVSDRYSGVYSGGKYIAWNLYPCDVPVDSHGDDVTCATFWSANKIPVGKGRTIQEAITNLIETLSIK